jgi:hypothetical protein
MEDDIFELENFDACQDQGFLTDAFTISDPAGQSAFNFDSNENVPHTFYEDASEHSIDPHEEYKFDFGDQSYSVSLSNTSTNLTDQFDNLNFENLAGCLKKEKGRRSKKART